MYEENELYAKPPLVANGVKKNSKSKGKSDILINNTEKEKETEMQALNVANNITRVSDDSLAADTKYSISITGATAKWSENSSENSLSDVSTKVEKGHLLAIVGPVGSGKVSVLEYFIGSDSLFVLFSLISIFWCFQSSLLQAILRELPLKSGNIEISGTISYASQEPWLFAGSVRQNILFGLPMDRERYRQVIYF